MAKGKRKPQPKSRPKPAPASSGGGKPAKAEDISSQVKSKSVDRPRSSAAAYTASDDMPFGKINYIMMIVGVAVMFLGYILMSGGGTDDPNSFNPAIFGTQRIIIAPLVILLGIVIEIYAILKKSE